MKDTQARYRAFLTYSHSDATRARWLRPLTQAYRVRKCQSRDGRHAARGRHDDSHGGVDSASSAWRSTSNESSANYQRSKVTFNGKQSLILSLPPNIAKEISAQQRAVFTELETAPMQSGTKI